MALSLETLPAGTLQGRHNGRAGTSFPSLLSTRALPSLPSWTLEAAGGAWAPPQKL